MYLTVITIVNRDVDPCSSKIHRCPEDWILGRLAGVSSTADDKSNGNLFVRLGADGAVLRSGPKKRDFTRGKLGKNGGKMMDTDVKMVIHNRFLIVIVIVDLVKSVSDRINCGLSSNFVTRAHHFGL